MNRNHIALFLFMLTLPSGAMSSGISKPVNVGSKAIGMGGAFVGIADDPTAIYHNPAGIAFLPGRQFEIGFDALVTNENYSPDKLTFASSLTEKAKRELLPVPQFGFVMSKGKIVHFGLGLFFPHGNGVQYHAPSAALANPAGGRIYSTEFSPVLALTVTKNLSIGGSFRVVRISQSLENQVLALGLTIDKLKATGWGAGGAFGALYKPSRYFSIGANWRSKATSTLKGDAALVNFGKKKASLSQVLPMLFSAGIGVSLIEKLTIGLSYDFERNSEVKQIDAALESLGNLTLPQNWKNSHTIHAGAECRIGESFSLRAGYAKDLNASIPDSAMNRVIGDIAAREISAGVAHGWRNYRISAAWNGRFGKRTIASAAANPAAGRYEAFVNLISLSIQKGF
jgi:long-chain fatty acid transport protein